MTLLVSPPCALQGSPPDTVQLSGRPTLRYRGGHKRKRGIEKFGCDTKVWMWETSTLKTYRSGLRKLFQVHWARLEWSTPKALMPKSRPNSEMDHSQVSYAPSSRQQRGQQQWDIWMRPSRQAWGKCSRWQQNEGSLQWGSFAVLMEMAKQANTPLECCVVAAAVLSTLTALRILETTTLKVRNINGLARRSTFWDQKVNHKWYTRPLS